MPIHYKLAVFEGPLDLLLHLIDKAEVDIYNIPIHEITDQYMEYIRSIQEFELEPASEFLVMAATLLSIKSRMLLPKPPVELVDSDEEEDPRMELARRLAEYRRYKQLAEEMRQMEVGRSLIFSREATDLTQYLPETQENPVRGIYVADLWSAFGKVLQTIHKRERVATIQRDEISVGDRMVSMLNRLRAERMILFSSLFTEPKREEVIASFLALLELLKRKQISCVQYGLFDDIVIKFQGEEDDDLESSRTEIDY